MHNFRTYNLARQLYFECRAIRLNGEAKKQLDRASLSIVLNLAEGSGKLTAPDKKRFYSIALGSLRETQALVDLFGSKEQAKLASFVGACLWKLIRAT